MKYSTAAVIVFLLNLTAAGAIASDLSDYPALAEVSTLEETLAGAYINNPDIKKARADFETTAEQRSQAFSRFLPSATANLDYGRQKTEIENIKTTGNVNSRSLNAEQPIFRGGNFSRLDATENRSIAAGYELKNIEQEVLLSSISAYMNLVTDASLLEVTRNKENVLYRQYQETGKRFKAGELAKTDVSQSISRVSAATSEAAINEANYEASRANFERIIGNVPGALTIPNILPQIPASVDEALVLSRESNPAIKAAQFSEKAAEDEITVSEGQLAPSLSLRGRMYRDDEYSLTGGKEYANDQVTLNLSIPLYQSGSEYSRVRQAKSEASARKYQYFASTHRSDEQVKSIWKRVIATTKAIEANQLAVQAAQMALQGVRKEEQLGTRTVLDVLDAEQELSESKSRALRTKRDQVIAYYTLLARIGRLTAQDLSLPVEYYDPQKHYDDVKNQFIGF